MKTINKKRTLFISIGFALAISACIFAFVYSYDNQQKKYERQISLAERYLNDMDYEQAIVAYRVAIEIDPMGEEAYLGLAEAYVAIGDYQSAIAVLLEGKQSVDSVGLEKKLQELQEMLALKNAPVEPEIEKEPESEVFLVNEAKLMIDDEMKVGEVGWRGGDWINRDDVLPYMNDEGYIVFGAYEQDGDELNGPELIEWEVLDDSGEKMLLISRYVLDAQPFSNEDIAVTWETCSLRKWLNEDFLSKAFTVKEQEIISISTIHNMDNAYWGTEGGNDTQDKIFLLDVEQICQHCEYNSWDKERMMGYSTALIIEPTEYAKKRDVFWMTITEENYDKWNLVHKNYGREVIGNVGSCWWLRTLGHVGYDACVVGIPGSAGWFGGLFNAGDVGGGVRPVLYIESDGIDKQIITMETREPIMESQAEEINPRNDYLGIKLEEIEVIELSTWFEEKNIANNLDLKGYEYIRFRYKATQVMDLSIGVYSSAENGEFTNEQISSYAKKMEKDWIDIGDYANIQTFDKTFTSGFL